MLLPSCQCPVQVLVRSGMINTAGTIHATADEFVSWLSVARPGEVYNYATGDIAYSSSDKTISEQLRALREQVYAACEDGKVHLTSRRLSTQTMIDGDVILPGAAYEYLATKCSPPPPAAVTHVGRIRELLR